VEIKEYLGLDVGLKRTGIARASDAARLAEPLLTVATADILTTLKELIKEHGVSAIVIGLPRNLSGSDTKQTSWVRDFVINAKNKIDLPFYWQDEALTSRIAEAKKAVHKHAHDVDSLAAAIILQDFLETPEADWVIC
jgi:putative Holliday junction resolvase